MIAQGKEAAKLYFKEHPKLAKEIHDAIWKAVKSGTTQPKIALGEAAEE